VAFPPGGKTLASGSWDKTVKLWNVKTGKKTATFLHGYLVNCVAFRPDGKVLASGSWPGSIELWDLKTGKNTGTLGPNYGTVEGLAFSPNGKTLASSNWDFLLVWNVKNRKSSTPLVSMHKGLLTTGHSVAFSPNGKTLAWGCDDKTIKLWDVKAAKKTATLKGHSDYVNTVAFSRDGKTLASGSEDKTIKLWRMPEDKKAVK
jgi:WD40 repeat protein